MYSVLSRVGFNTQIFDQGKDAILKNVTSNQFKIDEEDELVWLNLHEILKTPNPIRIKNQSLFEGTKKSMEAIVENTKISHYAEDGEHIAHILFGSTKYAPTNSRKRKIETTDEHRPINLLDIMKCEKEYSMFKDIFERIQIFDTINCDDEEFGKISDLKIDFDLYFPSTTKSELDYPNFRLIVLGTQNVPSKSEIIHLYQKQMFKVPLMFIYVSNNMNFHAFIYRFS